MNPFDSSESIVVDRTPIRLPILQGKKEDPSTWPIFQKPSWIADEDCLACTECGARFTQVRRRHHCRNCGQIFCSKCCLEKIPMPHFGILEPEKVCNKCKLVVELIGKAKAPNSLQNYEAMLGFSSLLANVTGMAKVVECGGIHIMLSTALTGDTKLKNVVASSLHSLAQNMTLNNFLVEAGFLKVLKNFLGYSEECSQELISNSLSSLNLLCMDPPIRIQVLKAGLVDPLMTLAKAASGIPSLFAARILQLLFFNFEHHAFILQNHPRVITDLFDAMQMDDHQMQGSVSKMLMYFSASTASFRDLILQEDANRSHPLLSLLKGKSQGALLHVTCTVANLALCMEACYSSSYITGMCELLPLVNKDNSELLTQLGRGLANFAEHSENQLHVVSHFPIITSCLLEGVQGPPRAHACRAIASLLSSNTSSAVDALSRSGLKEFLETIFELPGITETLNNLLLRKVSRLSVCQPSS